MRNSVAIASFVILLAPQITVVAQSPLSPFFGGLSGEQKEKFEKQRREMQSRMAEQQLMSQLMRVTYSKTLQRELGVDEIQIREIRETNQAYNKKMMEFHTKHREDQQEIMRLSKEGDHDAARELSNAYREKQSKMKDDMTAMAEAILLPDQLKRLRQISKQQIIKRQNPFGDEFGAVLALANELELSADERAELTKVIVEARRDYYEETEKLKEKARKKIFNALSSKKRNELKEILGDNYDQTAQTRMEAEDRRKRMAEQRKKLDELRQKAEEEKQAALEAAEED